MVAGTGLFLYTAEKRRLLAEEEVTDVEGRKRRNFSAAAGLFGWGRKERKEAKKEEVELTPEARLEAATRAKAGRRVEGLPEFSMSEVRGHDGKDKGVWVTFRSGVYDITKLVPKHPGTLDISVAAGGQLETFWEQYAMHKDNPHVSTQPPTMVYNMEAQLECIFTHCIHIFARFI